MWLPLSDHHSDDGGHITHITHSDDGDEDGATHSDTGDDGTTKLTRSPRSVRSSRAAQPGAQHTPPASLPRFRCEEAVHMLARLAFPGGLAAAGIVGVEWWAMRTATTGSVEMHHDKDVRCTMTKRTSSATRLQLYSTSS